MKPFYAKTIDFLCQPITWCSVMWLKFLRLYVLPHGTRSERILMRWGLYPILDQYYEPLVNPKKHLKKSLLEDRILPGINWNVEEQLRLLDGFHYNNELIQFPLHPKEGTPPHFYYHNEWYSIGDAEYLYNMIRHTKPKRLIEVGAGFSTLLAVEAIRQNQQEDPLYACKHTCIEPFERPWLESLDVEVIRKKVETVDLSFFQDLEKDDILFIDSSHIIRPQ